MIALTPDPLDSDIGRKGLFLEQEAQQSIKNCQPVREKESFQVSLGPSSQAKSKDERWGVPILPLVASEATAAAPQHVIIVSQ